MTRSHDERATSPRGATCVMSLRQWGDRHAAPNGPPVRVFHRACGHAGRLELHCADCGEPVTYRDVRVEPAKARKRS